MSNDENDLPDPSVALDDPETDDVGNEYPEQTPFDPSWLHRSEAMNRIGCSITTLRRMVERGQLHPRRVDGQDRFDPVEVARFAAGQRGNAGSGFRDGAAATPWSAPGADAASSGAAQVIRASTALTEQAQAHLEKMFEMTRKTTEVLLDAITEQMKLSHAQTLELEKQNMDMRAAAERAKTEEHQRQLATLEYQRRTRMQEKALESLKAMLPLVKWYLVQKHPELLGLARTVPPRSEVPSAPVTPANSNGSETPIGGARPSASAPPISSGDAERTGTSTATSSASGALGTSETGAAAKTEPKQGLEAMLAIAENICMIVATLSDDQIEKLRSSGALAPEHVEALVAIRRELQSQQ